MVTREECPELVVFDMTGTTIENTGMVADAFTAALHASGIEVSAEEVRVWRGASKRQAIRHFIETHSTTAPSEKQVEKIYADFHDRLCQQFETEGLRPIAGAEETFGWLRAHGIRLTFNTGFDRDLADLILRAVGWD
jgi:phosphoglycolate phosphatase-like HAD superfamily hydrolase